MHSGDSSDLYTGINGHPVPLISGNRHCSWSGKTPTLFYQKQTFTEVHLKNDSRPDASLG